MKKIALIIMCVFCFAGVAAAETPLAYPFSSWGEISSSHCDTQDDDFKFAGAFEQGVDWFKLNQFTFNTFASINITQSDNDRNYWDNKVGLYVGAKIKHPLKLAINNWGTMALGIRAEFYDYTSDYGPSKENCVVVFFQWSFGGDWKKR
jgi:hypothetical protein